MRPDDDRSVTICGLAGSLRAASFNRALLVACVELAPAGMTIEAVDLRDVPLYDADVEAAGLPDPVVMLRHAIADADGLLIVTPEYNAGLPAVTKNAVDWASRRPRPSPLDGKPVAVMGATPSLRGTTRAQAELRISLAHAGAVAMPRPELFVPSAAEKFEDGRLVDGPTRERVAQVLEAFAGFVTRLSA